jgi:hypothetical protein
MSDELGIAHYASIEAPPPKEDYVVFGRIEDMDDGISVDVVNLWLDALALTGIVTLANSDHAQNDAVIIPYAAGCQSIWTIPYKETFQKSPKAVVGAVDPVVRSYLPSDVVSFSIPVKRFIEMCQNVSESFLKLESWTNLVMDSLG